MRSPPAVPFPFCECNRTVGTVPFEFSTTVTTKRSGANRLYCMKLYATDCIDPKNSCCNQNLAKIEWWTKDACRGSVKATYMDGVKVDQQWDTGTFKIPGLNLPRSAVPPQGREICLELLSTGTCPTLKTFCAKSDRGVCYYSAFNTDKDCCPVQTVDNL
ncbi:hypothetical protein HYH03_011425 [Edaphochlamys debaryana]|uniref:Pherophorin domain-containing protein n=1 Tax=Edaphochlamys debaryana TaxID=47281 RepID=A0A836BWH4_9CHLO|nr:hypothetical protein HYH03_011425 [Edaphochlamys debaryana]|eukprot:KAG2490119.1 hypothetical protein HYH03_011425 [Edaphochlamys debaryana]